MIGSSHGDVGLLDVVPWTHGYAHSWALRWLIVNDPGSRDALLALMAPGGQAPWHVEPESETEFKVARSRADVRIRATDDAGSSRDLLVETKVNDALKPQQLKNYCEASADVVVFAPGLTGLLYAGNPPIARERWLTGQQFATALERTGEHLPPLLRGYITEVAAQAERHALARSAARGEAVDFAGRAGSSGVSDDDVEAVAWIHEVAAALRAKGETNVTTRDTAYDYGVFFGASARRVPGIGETRVFVEVVAQHGGHSYAITIKVGGHGGEDRLAVHEKARSFDLPGPDWRGCALSRKGTSRLWKRSANDMSADEAASMALLAKAHIEAFVSCS